jgi:ABC-type uncharacterized transport system permease subunit
LKYNIPIAIGLLRKSYRNIGLQLSESDSLDNFFWISLKLTTISAVAGIIAGVITTFAGILAIADIPTELTSPLYVMFLSLLAGLPAFSGGPAVDDFLTVSGSLLHWHLCCYWHAFTMFAPC